MPTVRIAKQRRQHGKYAYETKAARNRQRKLHPDQLPEAVKHVLEVLHPALYGKEHLH